MRIKILKLEGFYMAQCSTYTLRVGDVYEVQGSPLRMLGEIGYIVLDPDGSGDSWMIHQDDVEVIPD